MLKEVLDVEEIREGAVVESLNTGLRYRLTRVSPTGDVAWIESIDGDHRGDGWCLCDVLVESYALIEEGGE